MTTKLATENSAVETLLLTQPDGKMEGPPRVPGYLTLGLIGRSDSGAVYLAHYIDGGEFAIKVLPLGWRVTFAEDEGVKEKLRALHPNVAKAYDAGVSESDDRQHVVSEYCPGGTLSDRIARNAEQHRQPYSIDDTVAVVEKLADGLAALHAIRIAHGHLSPTNILFDAGGVPKICDFGFLPPIQTPLRAADAVPRSPDTVPRVVQPDGGDAIRSDVYALGVVAYAILVGDGPPKVSTSGVVPTIARIRDINPKVPVGLAAIIHRCLDPNPVHRFASARALQRALSDYRMGRGKLSRLLIVLDVASRQLGRHIRRRWREWALLALFVAGVVGFGFSQAVQAEQTRKILELRDAKEKAEAEADEALISIAEMFERFRPIAEERPALVRARGRLTERAITAAGDPQQAAVARLWQRCGKIAFSMGDHLGAADDYDRALECAEKAASADASPENTIRLGVILREWGVTRAAQAGADAEQGHADAAKQKIADARRSWDRAFDLLRPYCDTDPLAQLTTTQLFMVKGNAAAQSRERTVVAFESVGSAAGYLVARRANEPDAATADFATAVGLLRRLLAYMPDDMKGRFTLAETLTNRFELSSTDSGLEDCDEAVRIRRRLVQDFPNMPVQKEYLASSLNSLGNALRQVGRRDEARNAYEESRRLYEALIIAFPSVLSNQVELEDVMSNLKDLE